MATIVVWFLQTFDLHFNVVSDSKESILAMIAGVIMPIFMPLGFSDWRISTALLTGMMAKESVVSTLNVLIPSRTELFSVLTPLSTVSLLVFCLLYTPCVAAIASIRKELGGKTAAGVAFWQFGIAWIVSFVVYNVGVLLVSM